jgi:uncharacterized membrane protein
MVNFLAAIGTFILALAMGAPFPGAVLLAAGAWAVVHFARGDLRRLNERISHLEKEVALLKGEPVSDVPVADVPVPEVPVADVPVPQPLPAEPAPAFETPAQSQPLLQPQPQPVPDPQPIAEQPSFLSRLISGNIVAKVGAVVLFFGVGFLLKFAYDRNMVSPEVRVLGVALAAAAASAIGWRLLERRRLFGVILQGVASGLAYLDVFFALKTYGFIGAPAGFALFAALGVGTTLLAVRLDAKPMAILGLTGAFMAPILASTGSGNHVMLFSYYLLLNLFILGVSWFRAWRALNLTGWFFTFAVAVLWGSRSYRPELFGTVEPFLIAFFAIYLVIPILFATRQPPQLKGWVDGTLVFGTPAAVAVLQAQLVSDMEYGLAWSCALGAALYAALAIAVFRREHMQLLRDTYIALAVGLGTLAIFFAFGAYTTFALWTIEGAALLWVCLRQKHLLGRVFALLVQGAGAVQFFLHYNEYLRLNPWFNDAILGCAIITVAASISAALYRRYDQAVSEGERGLAVSLLAWAALCWSVGGVDAIHHGVEATALKPAVAVLFFTASALAAELWGARLRWNALRGLSALHPLVLAGAALFTLSQLTHPLAHLGWLAWPAGFGALFWMLHRQRAEGFDGALDARYAGAWLLLAALATWEAGWWLHEREYQYTMALGLAGYVAATLRYRLREHGRAQGGLSTLALGWAMIFWYVPGLLWIGERMPGPLQARASLAFVSLSALACWLHSAAHDWPAARKAALLPWIALPAALLYEFVRRSGGTHPFDDPWALAWPLALGLAAWTLRREEADDPQALSGYRHMVLLYMPIALLTWEALWWLAEAQFGSAWQLAFVAVPAALVLLWVSAARSTGRWPLDPHWPLYRDVLLLPIVAGLAVWSAAANLNAPGGLGPLGAYLPLLNPIDLAIALAALAVAAWGRSLERAESRGVLWKALGILAFAWVNAIALRTVHYWDGVPYRFDELMSSVLVQATLSILWTTSALALMLLGRHRLERRLWVAGAALLAVVVGKLFLVDLASTGTVARIVSFLGVGVMLLVIGYAAPVPPGAREAEGKG